MDQTTLHIPVAFHLRQTIAAICFLLAIGSFAQSCKIDDRIDPFTKERLVETEAYLIFNRVHVVSGHWSLRLGYKMIDDSLLAKVSFGSDSFSHIQSIEFLFDDGTVLSLNAIPTSIDYGRGIIGSTQYVTTYMPITQDEIGSLASKKITMLRWNEKMTREITPKDSEKINHISQCLSNQIQ